MDFGDFGVLVGFFLRLFGFLRLTLFLRFSSGVGLVHEEALRCHSFLTTARSGSPAAHAQGRSRPGCPLNRQDRWPVNPGPPGNQ